MNKKRTSTILVLLALILVVIVGYTDFSKKQKPFVPEEEVLPPTVQVPTKTQVSTLALASAVALAPAKTEKISVPVWKIFYDRQYSFWFSYPETWSAVKPLEVGQPLRLKDELGKVLVVINPLVDKTDGISFCGLNSTDTRCEVLLTDSGEEALILWDNNLAGATLSLLGGTKTVDLALLKVTPDSKNIFRKIISTFRFVQ